MDPARLFPLHSWLDPFTAQQDLVWTLATVAWLLTGLLWLESRRGRSASSAWLGPVAAGQVLLALLQLFCLVLPPADPVAPPRLWDVSAVLGLAVLAAATAASGIQSRPGRAAGLLVAAALTAWQLRQPIGPGQPVPVHALFLLLGLASLAAGVAVRRSSSAASPILRWLPLICLLPAWLYPHGPLAEVAREARRWMDLSVFGLPAALGSLAAAALALAAQVRLAGHLEWWGSVHRLRWRLTLLFGAGLSLALWSGRAARRDFETSLLGRARVFASLIEPGPLAPWLETRFALGEFRTNKQFFGGVVELYRAPAILDPEIQPLRAYLGRLRELNPDLISTHFATLRDGQLVAALDPLRGPKLADFIARHRPATPGDEQRWAGRMAYFTPPFTSRWGAHARAAAPVVEPATDQMLGWLSIDASVGRWMAVQAAARQQTLALFLLAAALLVLAERHRARTAERAAALTAAQAATAADQAKTAFLAQVSHELRTPIQSILGYAELMQSTTLPPDPARWLGSLQSHGHLLIRLVNDLLDLTSLHAGAFRLHPEPFDLHALVSLTVESLAPRAAVRGLSLSLETLPPAPVWVSGDASRVRQIVQNLVTNAVKFTPGGSITAHLKLHATAEGLVDCTFGVTDTGPGIPPAEHERIFQPFVRLPSSGAIEGAGLGLALSRQLCRAMDGDLTVASDGHHGSTFTASWRLPATAPLAEAAISPGAAARPLTGQSILVADDNTLIRTLFTEFLLSQGARVDTACNGQEALERATSESYSAIVLDLSMPLVDGFAVARGLMARQPRPRIVGVSAHADAAERTRALAAGMDVFLVKPVPLRELLAALQPSPAVASLPVPDGLPPELAARLWRQYYAEAPRHRADLQTAWTKRDWVGLATLAHHLKNSADLLGLTAMRAACVQLERAAQATDPALAVPAIDLLQAALQPPSPSLS